VASTPPASPDPVLGGPFCVTPSTASLPDVFAGGWGPSVVEKLWEPPSGDPWESRVLGPVVEAVGPRSTVPPRRPPPKGNGSRPPRPVDAGRVVFRLSARSLGGVGPASPAGDGLERQGAESEPTGPFTAVPRWLPAGFSRGRDLGASRAPGVCLLRRPVFLESLKLVRGTRGFARKKEKGYRGAPLDFWRGPPRPRWIESPSTFVLRALLRPCSRIAGRALGCWSCCLARDRLGGPSIMRLSAGASRVWLAVYPPCGGPPWWGAPPDAGSVPVRAARRIRLNALPET